MVRNILTVHLSKEAMICKGLQSIQYLQCLAMVLEPEITSSSTQQSVKQNTEMNTAFKDLHNYTSEGNFVTTDTFIDEPLTFPNTDLTTYHEEIEAESTTVFSDLDYVMFTSTEHTTLIPVTKDKDYFVDTDLTTHYEDTEAAVTKNTSFIHEANITDVDYDKSTIIKDTTNTAITQDDNEENSTWVQLDDLSYVTSREDTTVTPVNEDMNTNNSNSAIFDKDEYVDTEERMSSSLITKEAIITSTASIFTSQEENTNYESSASYFITANVLSQVATKQTTLLLETQTLISGIHDWLLFMIVIIIMLCLFLSCIFCLCKTKGGKHLKKLLSLIHDNPNHARMMSVSPVDIKEVKYLNYF